VDMPKAPQSFNGELLDITWEVKAWFDMDGEEQQLVTEQFRMVIP